MTWDSLLDGYDPLSDFMSYFTDVVGSTFSSGLLQSFFIGSIESSEAIIAFIVQMTVILLVFVVVLSIGYNAIAPIIRKAARW